MSFTSNKSGILRFCRLTYSWYADYCPGSPFIFYCSLWEQAGVTHCRRHAHTRLQHYATSYFNSGGWQFTSAVVWGDWNTNVSLLVHLEGTPRDWRFQSVEEVLAAGVVVVTSYSWVWVGKHCGQFFGYVYKYPTLCARVCLSVCVLGYVQCSFMWYICVRVVYAWICVCAWFSSPIKTLQSLSDTGFPTTPQFPLWADDRSSWCGWLVPISAWPSATPFNWCLHPDQHQSVQRSVKKATGGIK